MKIIFSPSKSQHTTSPKNETENVLFSEKTKQLLGILKSYHISDFKRIYKISDVLAEKTYKQYQSFNDQPTHDALGLFSGTSFKQLDFSGYPENDHLYINDHLVILSALYGCLEPDKAVYPYRLDMNNAILKDNSIYKNLYDFWKNEIHDYFQNEDVVINLASDEYANMMPLPVRDGMVNVHFIVQKNGIEKIVSMDAKKQRGKLLNYMIIHNILDPKELCQYVSDGYVYSPEKSDMQNIVFIKK